MAYGGFSVNLDCFGCVQLVWVHYKSFKRNQNLVIRRISWLFFVFVEQLSKLDFIEGISGVCCIVGYGIDAESKGEGFHLAFIL